MNNQRTSYGPVVDIFGTKDSCLDSDFLLWENSTHTLSAKGSYGRQAGWLADIQNMGELINSVRIAFQTAFL